MRVSYKWLQEYVELGNISPEELAEKMTLSGVAVENIEYLGKGIEKVVVGQILTIEKHPDADKLVICQVDVGNEQLQIVTGANNIQEKDIVPVALVGASLPNGLKIKKSKLRGVASAGMLCSAEELGIDKKYLSEEEQKGILILAEGISIGVDIKPILGLDDTVLELELTPNRSDCLSMLGVAYEVAAVLGTEVKPPQITVNEGDESIDGKCSVEIKSPDLCNRYVARLIKNIELKPSPNWMQQRLRAAGVRPINNIVDVTNYVMLELGQPLHAFDYETLSQGKIIVRNAQQGEKFTTLDGNERTLDSEMLVIADAEKAVALAGVMGGLDSEVTSKTKHILLESAQFNGASIRKTSRKLGLRSEASARFEKGVDGANCLRVADRAMQLMAQLGNGQVVSGYVDNYIVPVEEKKIKLRLARVNQILGIQLEKADVLEIFANLKFAVEDLGNELLVQVPTFRSDLTIEVDLIEEVARLYGYNKIPTTLPSGDTTQGRLTEEQAITEKIKDIMVSCGLNEVVTLAFSNLKNLDLIQVGEKDSLRNVISLQNPLSEEQSILRTTLVPGLLEVLARNNSRRNKDMAIFELTTIFNPQGENALPDERLTLGVAAMGKLPTTWNQKGEAYDFYHLKGILENLLNGLGVTGAEFVPLIDNPSFHPGKTAAINVNGNTIGVIGEIHPNVIENFDLPDGVIVFQLDIPGLLPSVNLQVRYQRLAKYPGAERDLAVVAKAELKSAEILNLITKVGGKLVREVKIFDVYQGKQIAEGYKSMAFTLKYQAEDRTLTDEELNSIQAKIAKELKEKLDVEMRLQ